MMRALRMLALGCLVALSAAPVPAQSQDKPSASQSAAERRAARRAARAAKKSKRDKPKAEAADNSAEPKPVPESQASTAASAAPAPPPALDDATVRKEGETEVKTVEFSGLDIEGQLKTPQLLYFLTRLRAEFGRPRLPHRSFMPELSRTTGEKALR